MDFKLPLSVVGQSDINRLFRELDSLDDFFISSTARKAGTPVKPPRITYLLEQIARDNKINLIEEPQREQLRQNLQQILKTAPVVHISFAAEPTPRIIDNVLGWLRTNIDSRVLLQVGLQPTIAAGCVLRTPNQIFDMSLRQHLKKQENYLVELIQGAVSGKR